MEVEFDAAKDAINVAKHGVSLARAAELDIMVRVFDERHAEPRMRAYGLLDGLLFSLAYTAFRGKVRAISLRRAHLKEFKRYVQAE